MLGIWDGLVGCLALLGIVVIAFGIMLRIVDVSEGLRRLGLVLGCAVLLTLLPSVIVALWSGLSIWQKIGILSIVAAAVLVLAASCRRSRFQAQHRNPR